MTFSWKHTFHFQPLNNRLKEDCVFRLQKPAALLTLWEGMAWVQSFFALMTLEPTPSADIFKNPTWAPDWGWREGEAVEALKHHSTLCARGKAWTARAGDHRRKAWRIKRERKNHGREGRKRWRIKRERKNHGREGRKGWTIERKRKDYGRERREGWKLNT